jgi:hypothetical protein
LLVVEGLVVAPLVVEVLVVLGSAHPMQLLHKRMK